MSSSIHIQKASGGAIAHNSRENYSKSVVFTDEKNELLNDKKQAYEIYRTEINKRIEAYTNRTNQKLQKTAVTQLSAVVNLEQHHTLKDLEKIKEELEKVFDTKVYQMAIHRDEGKIKHKETNEYLVSGIDFFYNPDDEKYYTSKRVEDKKHIFENELNIFEYEIEKNYHAHIEMLGLDSQGQAIRQKMNRFVLSQLQDFTALALNMERGKNYLVDKSNKRLDTHELKESKKRENEVKKIVKKEKNKIVTKANKIISREKAEKEKLKEELELLKKENSKFREELKANEDLSKRENFKKQEDLNKKLQEDLKASKIDLATALEKIEDLKEQLFNPDFKTDSGKKILNTDAVKYLVNVNQELEKRIKDLEKNLNQEHSITNPTFQQKILFEKYQHLIKTDLKGFFIDTKNDETKIQNKAKNIDIVDKGNSIISNSNGAKNLEQRVTIMIDIAIAKGWDIEKLNIKGEDSFLIEAKRQINERLLLKELNSYKTNLNSLQAQNEQLANEIITLNSKATPSSNMSELEDIKNKNKELERYLKASLLVVNSKNKELNAKEGKEVYPTNVKKSDLTPLVIADVKKEFEKKNKIPNQRNQSYQREI